jgi:dihydrodipicolinate synthase/N-acetylneuraminate lyase
MNSDRERHQMSHSDLTGILVALVTPFTADGSEIDAAALERHVDRLVAAGVHGLVPGGSTGEFVALTFDER